MAKETVKKWTEDERAIGEKLLKALTAYTGTFEEKKNLAAKSIGYPAGYFSLPPGVKSFISSIAGKAKKRKTLKTPSDGDLTNNRKDSQVMLEQLLSDYWSQMEKSSDFFSSRYDDADELQKAIQARENEN